MKLEGKVTEGQRRKWGGWNGLDQNTYASISIKYFKQKILQYISY